MTTVTTNDFKKLLDEALNPIIQKLEDPESGLEAINRRLDVNTGATMQLEETVKGYGDMYKINDSNIRKIEKRLETIEEKEDIEVPQDLRVSNI